MFRRFHLLLMIALGGLCFMQPEAALGEASRSDAAIAVFSGGIISVADMEASLARKLPETRQQLATPDGRKQFLDELVRYDLLALEAERRGYGRNPVVVEAIRQAAIDAWLAHEDAAISARVGDAEIAQYYEAHLEKFRPAPLRRASHILVASEPAARTLITQLGHATPEEFARVASSMSQDARTARQGGELGFFDATGTPAAATQPPIPAALAAAVFALGSSGSGAHPAAGRARRDYEPPRLLQHPVRLADGFSVVMWTSEESRKALSLAEASDSIRAALAIQHAAAWREAFIQSLMDEQRSPVRYDLVEQLELAPAKMSDILAGHSAAPIDPRAPPQEMESDGI